MKKYLLATTLLITALTCSVSHAEPVVIDAKTVAGLLSIVAYSDHCPDAKMRLIERARDLILDFAETAPKEEIASAQKQLVDLLKKIGKLEFCRRLELTPTTVAVIIRLNNDNL